MVVRNHRLSVRLNRMKWILENTDAKQIESHHRIYRKGDL